MLFNSFYSFKSSDQHSWFIHSQQPKECGVQHMSKLQVPACFSAWLFISWNLFLCVLRLVCRVKGLLTKGKNGTPIVIDFKACIWCIFGWLFTFSGTNDAFVTISLGKEKFQTSVKQKALSELEWQEECELWVITLINNVRIVLQWHFYCFRAIPTQGNTAEIVLTALHQNFIGVDEFLGMVSLPLSNFDVYERPRTK